MKWITLWLVMSALCGCVAGPRAPDAASGDVRAIAWTRGVDAQPFRDRRGVCHVFSQDHPSALRTLGAQVQTCFDGALPALDVPPSAAAAVNVTWRKVDASRIDALFAASTDARFLNAAGRGRASIFAVNGFYEVHGDTCYVVVSDRDGHVATLGHEFKHCVDGEFHDERGTWRQYRAG